jgi:PAS domain S-box-containing protein
LARSGYGALFYGHPDGIYVFDLDGRFVQCNAALVKLTGYTEAELVEMTFAPIVHPAFEQSTWENFTKATHGTTTRYVTHGRTKSGDAFVVDVTNIPLRDDDDRVVAVLGIARDIGTLRDAIERVDRGQTIMRMAGRIAHFAGWGLDLVSGQQTWTDELHEMLGQKPGDTPSRENALGIFVESERATVLAAFAACIEQGEPIDLTTVVNDAHGRRLDVRILGEAERDASGVISRVHGSFHDISDVVESRRQLAARAALLDAAGDAILVRDLDDKIRYWNRSAANLYGWEFAEVEGVSVRTLLYEDPTEFDQACAILMQEGQWQGELRQRTRDGRTIVAQCRWQLVRDDLGEPTSVFAVNTDVTERKREQELRLRAQRLESLGTLAGGIAHDLNNVLAPILMAVQLMKDSSRNKADQELLRSAESAALRGADMVRQVLSFARGVDGERRLVEPTTVLDELARFCRDTLPRSIDIRVERSDDLLPVFGDSTQILQVLINLVTNARDAMSEGGILTIRARIVADDVLGDLVAIDIEDTGCGMDEDLTGQVFDPFFSTKPVGHGTGLGLSTSLAIVESHGGTIQLRSEREAGTTAEVRLPAASVTMELQSALASGIAEVLADLDDARDASSAASDEGLRETWTRLSALATTASAVVERRGVVPDALHSLVGRLAAGAMALDLCLTDLRQDVERRGAVLDATVVHLAAVADDLQSHERR